MSHARCRLRSSIAAAVVDTSLWQDLRGLRRSTKLVLGRLVGALALSSAILLGGSHLAGAFTTQWNTDSSGVFTNPANWENGAPGSGDIAVLARGAAVSYTASFLGSPVGMPAPQYSTDRLIVRSNSVTLSRGTGVNGASFAVNNASLDPSGRAIIIGQQSGDVGKLTTTIPISTPAITIGDAAGSQGELDVAGSQFNIAGNNTVGDRLIVGNSGSGTLKITDGGKITLSGISNIEAGGGLASLGKIDVASAGSTLSSSQGSVLLGLKGVGFLSITGGGQVNDAGATIFNSGSATVDGAGSKWTNIADLNLGKFGGNGFSASLDLINGGQATGSSSTIGDSGRGLVEVLGAGSLWSLTGGLTVGFNSGIGTLNVNQGGAVTIGGGVTVGEDGVGFLIIHGGSAVTVNGPAFFGPSGRLDGSGTLTATVVNDGVLSPESGAFNIAGDFVQLGQGDIRILIGGATPGLFDQVKISGAATLSGAIDVQLTSGFMPSNGDSYDVLDFASLLGTFTSVVLPNLTGGLQWDASQLYTTGVLRVVDPTIKEADFDEDHDVDLGDLALWKINFGKLSGTSHIQGDADADGDTDGGDFLIWQRQLGGGGPALASSAAVPEPTSCALLAGASLLAAARPREARRVWRGAHLTLLTPRC